MAQTTPTYVDPGEGTVLQASTGVSKAVPPVLERIALCESQNDPHAKNGVSTASGRFQVTHGSWVSYGTLLWGSVEGKDVFNYKDNTDLATFMYEKEGVTPWLASQDCWR